MEQDTSSSKFNRLEFYKELYYKELERKSSLNNEIALQSTVLVAFLSGLFFLNHEFKSQVFCFNLLFQIAFIASLVTVIVTGYFLFRSYYDFLKKGRKYEYLPTLKEIESYYQGCANQNQLVDFDNFLIGTFVRITDSHLSNNDEKTKLLTKAAKWMTRFFFLAVSVVFLFLFQSPVEALYQIQNKVTPILDMKMENDNQQQSQTQTPTPVVVPENSPVREPLIPPSPRILDERGNKTPIEKK